MDAAFTLARNTVNVTYNDLPPVAVDMTKKDILDVLGTAVAGSAAPAAEEIAGLIKEWGGKQESTVIGFDCIVPSPSAAFINATMGHALDYDDTHDRAGLHAAVTVVPAAFAVAQRRGGVSGKEFITAVALGIDIVCRMGLASELTLKESGWVYTPIYGFFGATAAAGKILGLDEAKMVNAFGIAYSQTAGNFQAIDDAVLTKRIQPGFASRAGVLSALLAERGITGAQNSIEGDYGIYNVYHRGHYDPQALTSELGKVFEVANISFKPYPTCRGDHASIDATLALVREHDIKPEDVEEITVSSGEMTQLQSHPLERKRRPQRIPDAQYNIPYTVATAVVKRKVSISDFTLEAIQDPEVLKMADKVSPRLVPELSRHAMEPAIVEIKTRGGAYSKRVDYPKGSPQNPMAMDELAGKFRDCAAHGKRRMPLQQVERVIQLVSTLDEVDGVEQIIRLLG
jgi:2-methylcitrate dehydratase PrpD